MNSNENTNNRITLVSFDIYQSQQQVVFNGWLFAGIVPATGGAGTMLFIQGFNNPVHLKDDARTVLTRLGETLGISFDTVLGMIRENGGQPLARSA